LNLAKVLARKVGRDLVYQLKSLHSPESILSALHKSLGKRNVIEAFDQSYYQSNLMTELAKPTNLARWAILARATASNFYNGYWARVSGIV
jgi:hypothetical protein